LVPIERYSVVLRHANRLIRKFNKIKGETGVLLYD